jgi:transposase-like protein
MENGRMKQRQRTNRNAEAGARLVEEYCESGTTQSEFCDEREISVGTLQYWLRRIRAKEESATETDTQWLEVSLAHSEGALRSEPQAYELEFANGRRLRVRAGFDAQEVGMLIALIEGRSC